MNLWAVMFVAYVGTKVILTSDHLSLF